jgi:alpha-D-xyloside xylohydrolase
MRSCWALSGAGRRVPTPRSLSSLLIVGVVAAGCTSSSHRTAGSSGGQGGTSTTAGAGGSAAGGAATGGSGGGGTGGPIVSGAGGSGGPGGAGATGGTTGAAVIPTLKVACGTLKIELCTDDVIRVACSSSDAFFTRASLATAPKQCVPTPAQVSTAGGQMTITTDRLSVRVDTATGAVTFLDPSGATVLAEQPGGGRTLTAATIQGEATHNVRQEWQPQSDESLYGLGQHQQGHFDIKGYDLDLHQQNTEVFIPFLVSSRGYGILWDNTSYTRWGDLGQPQPIPGVSYASGTTNNSVQGASSGSVNWQGTVTAPTTGDYEFFTYASGNLQLDVNNQTVVNHWRQGWLPNVEIAKVSLQAGQQVPVHLQWTNDSNVDILQFGWKPPPSTPRTTSLWSEVGDGIDYYYVYGPELDDVIAGYRRLTGQAPMMPRWSFGFWQSREHYASASDITGVLSGYRSRGAPIDAIVQDWQYWVPNGWGTHQFDPARYPDPKGLVDSIHKTYNAHFMISVWAKFYTNTDNYKALAAKNFVFTSNVTAGDLDFVGYPFTYYDAFNPDARAMYWSQIDDRLFSLGVDAWWLDASEPEIVEGDANATGSGPFSSIAAQIATNSAHMNPTFLGTGARMHNAFSLVNSQAIYEGQRAAAPNQRVFILTRSGFAGQQRYGATTWSGDITSTWTAMAKQIPAGLGFSISGMPYWTLDGGGFAVPPRFAASTPTAADQAEWYELQTRWFEFATFLPIMRLHGQAPLREIWQFGGNGSPAYAAMLKFDQTRYQLLPYVYSLAGAVTHDAATILRPLVMDFRGDATAREVSDQYMFGPAFLVCPVTTYRATSRSVYLPPAAGWYSFWDGTFQAGGKTVSAAAPFDAMPVFVRVGSIVPIGPALQYADEKPADPIRLYVYTGADAAFTLYEDDGQSNDYESGAYTRIPITWTEASKTLTIGARQGSFPEMLASRTFQVVLISPAKAVGFSPTQAPTPDATITYTGAAISHQE